MTKLLPFADRIRRAALALLAALPAVPANAGSVVLWPINPRIAATEHATALWVENRGDAPVTLQVRSLGWTQVEGIDQYSPQDEVVASPPIATVAAGQRQLIRLVRRAPPTSGSERSYRLLIDELPVLSESGKIKADGAHVAVRMRYSIPLFTDQAGARVASAEGATAPKLNLRLTATQGQRFVEIHNTGNRHARLVDLRLVNGKQQFDIKTGLVGYVLPGAVMRWALPADTPMIGTILVNVNGADQSLSPNT